MFRSMYWLDVQSLGWAASVMFHVHIMKIKMPKGKLFCTIIASPAVPKKFSA